MISFPYDNQSETVQDRNIDSDTYAKYMDRMVGTNGIFLELGTKLEVTAGEGMTVLVKPGDGIITGHFFIEEDTRELQVQASESLDRIDTVVLRHDAEKRMIDLYVVKGTSATVPQPPELTREGGIYELGIANVYVPKLTDSIAQERITDTRLNTERCGVAPVLGDIDTQGLYDQYQASLDAFLELVNTAIDGTTAGHLQNQIDISETTISTLKSFGWTSPSDPAVIDSMIGWLSSNAKIVIEKGSNEKWQWEKYSDGSSKAILKLDLNTVFNNQYGGIYTTPEAIREPYPEGVFKSVDALSGSTLSNGAGGVIFYKSDGSIAMRLWNGTATSNSLEVSVNAIVKGKWN